ncbi:hypothetical protein AYO41_00045 [Verrucomicrobia bacterium SCGC AG-212-E04]|nr:hypothetical protein AYO41_00045 [Verrucomicrobia bacterium SCGC AG-212-E04]
MTPRNFNSPHVGRAWHLVAVAAVCITSAFCGAATHEEVVPFRTPPLQPSLGALVLASDGYYWGTTESGGTFNAGTIYKVRPDGSNWQLVLSFTGNGAVNRGANPAAGLVLGNDGNLYGTTQYGGSNSDGTVFCVTLNGALVTLVDFTGSGVTNRGAFPSAGLLLGPNGNFFGTTQVGGLVGGGTVFTMTPAGVLTTLVDFSYNGAVNRGATPFAPLVLGSDGNFYGSTAEGGSSGAGTIFQMTPGGALTTLIDFTFNGASNRGAYPHGPLVRSGTDFYGTTSAGGTGGFGTVFRVTSAGALTTLADFTGNGPGARGGSPESGLVLAGDGNYYGTTRFGGNSDRGTFFRITPGGILTTLVDFTGNGAGNRGTYPSATLVAGTGGNLFGTTSYGGANDRGTIFQVSTAGALTTLVELTYDATGNRGAQPYATLTLAADGSFFGTTAGGGANLYGTVFQLAPDGLVTTLVEFSGAGAGNRGANPSAPLAFAGGSYYGSTTRGGADDNGTLFQMSPAGVLTTLIEFTGNAGTERGGAPYGGLTLGTDGNFYGSTSIGGANGLGTVFQLTPAGALTTLVDFTGNSGLQKGAVPYGGLARGNDGNLYGTTSQGGAGGVGTIFRMTNAGALITLVEFTGNGASNRGAFPYAGLVKDGSGNFYGTTLTGGASDQGTVFRVTTAGALTTLAEFTGNGASNKGAEPYAGLTINALGKLFGTTRFGGAGNEGTIFTITPAGVLTTLVELSGTGPQPNTGGFPAYGFLTFGADGKLYGTAVTGGSGGAGNVFRVDLGVQARIQSLALTAGGPKVSALGEPGRTYFLQANNDLTAAWTTISGPLVAAPDGTFSFTDPGTPVPSQRFYRAATTP